MTTKENLINRLPHWMNKNDNSVLHKWLQSVADEIDAFVIQKDNLILSLQIDTAIGTELEDIGALYKLARQGGESDTLYRARIKSARTSFIGGGTLESLQQAFVAATGLPLSRLTITEVPDLKLDVSITLVDSSEAALVSAAETALLEAKAAGIGMNLSTTITLDESMTVSDSITISMVGAPPTFVIEESLIEGDHTLS